MLKKDEISLVPIEEKHLPFLVKWGNAGGLFKQFYNKKKTNISEQIKVLRSISENNSSQVLAIHLKGYDHPVGVCEIFAIDWINRTCFINIYLEDKSNVLGIHGFKVIYLALNYVFNRIGLYKVSTDILLEDNLSISLYKQFEFKTEVTKRRHAFVKGKYKTVLEMSILKHEFDRQNIK